MGVDVVNISFGGFTDISTPEGALVYQAYIDAAAYARSKGTVIVAAAGNEHVRVGAGGKILSHGELTTPGTLPEDFVDPFGQVTLPGGAPGYVDVAATNRVNVPSSASCPPGTIGDPGDPDADPPVPPDFNATCKPASDAHHAAGPGRRNQLSYYSNYGPRIDIAGPGGARKFNLGNYDRGGTPGFPHTLDDLTNAWQVFSTTSNWAVQIPCFTFTDRLRVPPGRVLLDHPGHLDGRAAGGRVAGPGGQRPPVAAQAPGGADRPAQAAGQRRPQQRHPGRCRPPTPRRVTCPGFPARPATATSRVRGSPTPRPTGPGWSTWPTRNGSGTRGRPGWPAPQPCTGQVWTGSPVAWSSR